MPNSNLSFDPIYPTDSDAHYSFIGWIPCVSGHLDFGLMKPGLAGDFSLESGEHDQKFINYSRIGNPDTHSRNIVLQSLVNWKDFTDNHRSGWTRVTVIAETLASDNLDNRHCHGYVILKRKELNPIDLQSDQLYQSTLDLETISNDYDAKTPTDKLINWPEAQSSLNSKFKQLSDWVDQNQSKDSPYYIVKFFINSNGLVHLDYVSKNLIHETFGINQRAKYTFTRQAFYYLKYSVHNHKHHSYDYDALTTIEPLKDPEIQEANKENRIENQKDNDTQVSKEALAGLKMIGRLKRELTNLKRSASNEVTLIENETLGISAYIASLIESLSCSGILDPKLKDRELNRLKNIENSFNAQSDRLEKKNSHENEIRTSERQLLQLSIAVCSVLFLIWYNLTKPNFVYSYSIINEHQAGEPSILKPIIATLLFFLIFPSIIHTRRWLRKNADVMKLRKKKIKQDLLESVGVIIGVSVIAVTITKGINWLIT